MMRSLSTFLFLAMVPLLGAQTLKPVLIADPEDVSVFSGAPDVVIDLKPYFAIDGVRGPIVRFETDLGQINVELFDAEAPVSVANFLSYAAKKSYDRSIFHRLDPDFVLQGGGFSVPTVPNAAPAAIPSDDPIELELGVSNLRGTLAMARTSDPDSASTQFYFNLTDNTTLDTAGGGYAVFGRVIGSSLVVMDNLAQLGVWNFGSPFGELPLVDYDGSSTLTEDDYAEVKSVRQIPLYPADGEPVSALTFRAFSGDSSLVSASIEGAELRLSFSDTTTGRTTVTVQGLDGDGSRATLSLEVEVAAGTPVITAQPLGRAVMTGGSVILEVVAESDQAMTYQWRRNGEALPGATGSSLSLTEVDSSNAGDYDVVVSSDRGTSTSSPAEVVVTSDFGTLTNLSTRSITSEEGSIVSSTPGFVIQGGGTIGVLARAVGPGLADFGVEGALTDPAIALSVLGDPGNPVGTNGDWESAGNLPELAAASVAVGAFDLKAGSRDSALLLSLPSSAYTATITSGDGVVGIVLGEVYLVGASADEGPALVNLSNRGQVGSGNEVMIGGFAVAGPGPVNLLIRGVGPTLGEFGVGNVLVDPVLTVRNSSDGVVAGNDDWSAGGLGPALASVASSVGAFPLEEGSADAALSVVLEPGSYTVVLSGKDGTTGTGLVEIYLVP